MEILQTLPYCSYVRVRYEDLVKEENTWEIFKGLYEFMGIPVDLETGNSKLGNLLHGGSRASHKAYYELSRDKNFDPNHWTKQLSREVR